MINEPSISGEIKTIDEAYNIFALWYEKCLEAGINPEKIVCMIGDMVLITQKDTIDFLIDNNMLSDD